jgi:hypothetical protein
MLPLSFASIIVQDGSKVPDEKCSGFNDHGIPQS